MCIIFFAYQMHAKYPFLLAANRDEYYNPDSKEAGKVEVLIEKNRFGPTGTIKLGFVAPMTKFVDLERVANR